MHLFQNAVASVKGDNAVRMRLAKGGVERPTHILAIGKAAVSMFEGLPLEWRESVPTHLVTKTGHIGRTIFSGNVAAFESSHPIPDRSSLAAGKSTLEFVANCPSDSRLLVFVSGGASALVEHLKPDFGLGDLVSLTEAAMSEGIDINEINRRRKSISMIKGGGLLASFKGTKAEVLAISDVAGGSIDVIGSGIGACPDGACFAYTCSIVASNAVARDTVEHGAKSIGIETISNKESMYVDVAQLATQIALELLEGPQGLYVYGGEPTIVLPDNSGQGGRNQALALEIARHIQNRTDIVGLVAGTDGTDGPTHAAGAFLDGQTYLKLPGAEEAKIHADSGSYLARTGDLLITGPTGTNVMDLAIFLKQS